MVIDKIQICKGIFIKRLNRFVCEVDINGKIELVHLNNTGKLLDLLVEGAEVLIMPIKGKKLRYRIVGTHVGNNEFTLIDTNLQERVFLKAHSMDLISFLKDYVFVKRNIRIEGEVFDFLFKGNGKELFVELKSAVYYFPYDKSARYPDTITIRGRKQLEKLKRLNGIVVFAAGHPYAEIFKPSYDDPEIPRILEDLKGNIYAIKLALKESGDILFLDGNLRVEV